MPTLICVCVCVLDSFSLLAFMLVLLPAMSLIGAHYFYVVSDSFNDIEHIFDTLQIMCVCVCMSVG